MFTVASVGLALLEEHAAPLGSSDTPRGRIIDEVYKPQKSDDDESRVERLRFAIAAGGDV